MKFLHLSDLHLGKTVNEISMLEDQRYILRQALDLAVNEHVDAVLIAGDVYDKTVPPEDAVSLLDDFLSALSALKIRVFIISGNHDSDERLNFGSRLFEKNGIYIAGKYDGTVHGITLHDEFGPVCIHLLPYIQRVAAAHFWPGDDTRTYQSAAKTILSHASFDFSRRNVLVAHQFVTAGGCGSLETGNAAGAGTEAAAYSSAGSAAGNAARHLAGDPELSGSETSALSVGTIDRISSSVFDGFDYVALGHIHRPQRVGRDSVRYGGSPLKYSAGEISQQKAFTLVTLGPKGTEPDIRLLPVRPLHEMRQLKGHLADLLRPENIQYPDDYVFVTLTDETPIPDAFAAIQKRYPNAMNLRYQEKDSQKDDEATYGQEPVRASFEEQMRDFYKRILGQDPSDEEMKILGSVAREAGIEIGNGTVTEVGPGSGNEAGTEARTESGTNSKTACEKRIS